MKINPNCLCVSHIINLYNNPNNIRQYLSVTEIQLRQAIFMEIAHIHRYDSVLSGCLLQSPSNHIPIYSRYTSLPGCIYRKIAQIALPDNWLAMAIHQTHINNYYRYLYAYYGKERVDDLCRRLVGEGYNALRQQHALQYQD